MFSDQIGRGVCFNAISGENLEKNQKGVKNNSYCKKINQKVEKAVKNNCFCKKINQKVEKAVKNNGFCKRINQPVERAVKNNGFCKKTKINQKVEKAPGQFWIISLLHSSHLKTTRICQGSPRLVLYHFLIELLFGNHQNLAGELQASVVPFPY